jgi:hypothetical protein
MEIPAHVHWDRECRSRTRRRAGRAPPGTGATWEAASSDIPDGIAETAGPTSKSYEDQASSTCVRVPYSPTPAESKRNSRQCRSDGPSPRRRSRRQEAVVTKRGQRTHRRSPKTLTSCLLYASYLLLGFSPQRPRLRDSVDESTPVSLCSHQVASMHRL